MTEHSSFASRRLVLRSFVLLFAGLLAVGVLLDRVLQSFADEAQRAEQALWVDSQFQLLASTLYPQTDANAALASWFEGNEQVEALLLKLEQAAMPPELMDDLQRGQRVVLFDQNGAASHFKLIALKHGPARLLSLTPNEPVEGRRLEWLSAVYYLVVFSLLGWWVWPLIRDIEFLNRAARRLGQDINADTPELGQVRELAVLSGTFATMAERIKGMVQGQKEMTNALSHELRTPLARVKFGLAVIKGRVSEDVQQELARIDQDINEFDELVGRMLDYARLDDPSHKPVMELIELQPWLAALCEKARSAERGISYSLFVEPELNSAPGDPMLLSLAFSNLFNNALKYADSEIAVEVRGVGEKIEIAIADNGPGIPPERIEDVFKAFTRVDDSRDRDTGGHGLGLAIVSRIVQLHGGRCRAENGQAGGARFSFTLPRTL